MQVLKNIYLSTSIWTLTQASRISCISARIVAIKWTASGWAFTRRRMTSIDNFLGLFLKWHLEQHSWAVWKNAVRYVTVFINLLFMITFNPSFFVFLRKIMHPCFITRNDWSENPSHSVRDRIRSLSLMSLIVHLLSKVSCHGSHLAHTLRKYRPLWIIIFTLTTLTFLSPVIKDG